VPGSLVGSFTAASEVPGSLVGSSTAAPVG